MMADPLLLIGLCALLTFATRVGGYLVLSRFTSVPPRVEAALDAVPAAVMTTLVVPAAITGGWQELAALAVAAVVALRVGLMPAVFASLGLAILLRNLL